MTTLDKINGEALAVPGFRFYGRHANDCFAIICQNEHGAVEAWVKDGKPDMGGIEIHSHTQLYVFERSVIPDCEILNGPCHSDYTLIGWDNSFLPLVEAGDSEGVLRELHRWHLAHVPGGAS